MRPVLDRLRPARDQLDGPAPAWPATLDGLLEAWARWPPRLRTGVRAAAVAVLLLAASGGLLRGPWGPAVDVLVLRVDVAAGTPLVDEHVMVARRPAELVPDDALRSSAELADGDAARGQLLAGAVLAERLVSRGGVSATAPPGTAVVPVPAELLPPLPVGTRLDVVVAGFDGHATVVARGAVLVADDGSWRWLQVARDEVAGVASGVTEGTLVAAALPPARSGGP